MPAGDAINDGAALDVDDDLSVIRQVPHDPLRRLVRPQDEPIKSKRDRPAGPKALLSGVDGTSHRVAGELAEVVAILVMLDEPHQARGERLIRLLAGRSVDNPLASREQLTFQHQPIERILRTELVTAKYLTTTSLQVSNEYDNQLLKAIELLPKAQQLTA